MKESTSFDSKSSYKQNLKSAVELNLIAVLLFTLSFQKQKEHIVKKYLQICCRELFELCSAKKINQELLESLLFYLTTVSYKVKCVTVDLYEVILNNIESITILIQQNLDGLFLFYALEIFEVKFKIDGNIEPLLLFYSLTTKFFVRNSELYPKKNLSSSKFRVLSMSELMLQDFKTIIGKTDLISANLAFRFEDGVQDIEPRNDVPIYNDVQTIMFRIDARTVIFNNLLSKFNQSLKTVRINENKFMNLFVDLEERLFLLTKNNDKTTLQNYNYKIDQKSDTQNCPLKCFDNEKLKLGFKKNQSNNGFISSSIKSFFGNILVRQPAKFESKIETNRRQIYTILDLMKNLVKSNPIYYFYEGVFFSLLRTIHSILETNDNKFRFLIGKASKILFKFSENDVEKKNIFLEFLITHTSQISSIESIMAIFLMSIESISDEKINEFKIIIINTIFKLLRTNLEKGKILLAYFLKICSQKQPNLYADIVKSIELIIYSEFLETKQNGEVYFLEMLKTVSSHSTFGLFFKLILDNVFVYSVSFSIKLTFQADNFDFIENWLSNKLNFRNGFFGRGRIINRARLYLEEIMIKPENDLKMSLKDAFHLIKFLKWFEIDTSKFEHLFCNFLKNQLLSQKINVFGLYLFIRTELLISNDEQSIHPPFACSKELICLLLAEFDKYLVKFNLKSLQTEEIIKLSKNCFELISIYSSTDSLLSLREKNVLISFLKTFLIKFCIFNENGVEINNEDETNLSQTFLMQSESILR